MAWLRMLPAWGWVALAGVVLAGLVGGVQQLRVSVVEAEAATARTDLSDYRLEISERDRRADARARAEERRRQVAIDEVENDAKRKLELARDDAVAAQSAADGLQREVARLRGGRSATCSAIAEQQRQAGTDAVGVLAELFESADRRAGALAAALDRSRIAGLACERSYNLLTPTY